MKYIMDIMPALMSGAWTTIWVFALTLVLSIPLGIVLSLGLATTSKNPLAVAVRWVLNIYTWIFRGTPLLLQLIFVFYGLPTIGVVFDRGSAVIFAFVLNYAAYFAEIFRGGFQAVARDQFEAATVLNMTRWQTLRYVIIPQVVKIVMPSIGNEVINLIKDSSLVYVIGLGDLLRAGNIATARDVTLVPLVLVGIIYLLMTFVLTMVQKQLEKRFAFYR
ncbi:amino acid ABC transporter permease [Lacticaseibacillus pabuli]|uniref:Amino acid ABC transporter permease n=1 Tax=Lacticaseibacillus pabuli TaxID=3025672 RepID=A0ABY7WRK9_9LACO|nr:amino acid ABC transporter permease [Lacticaseibacillus sp. KACC 23028]WDF81684.1 amino acid ABC transporter permease [Lacticaseibacillus sp. KACC 23028]